MAKDFQLLAYNVTQHLYSFFKPPMAVWWNTENIYLHYGWRSWVCSALHRFNSGNWKDQPPLSFCSTSFAIFHCHFVDPSNTHSGAVAHTISTSSSSSSRSSCATGQSPTHSLAFSRGGSLKSCEILAHCQTVRPTSPPYLSDSPSSPLHPYFLLYATPSLFHPPLRVTEICLR